MNNRLVLGLFILFAFAQVAQATTIYDTTSEWDGVQGIQPFGEPFLATMGQIFNAPMTDTRLDSFTFYITGFADEFVDFEAYVMAWDVFRDGAAAPVLYKSSPITTTNNNGAYGYESFTIYTGGVNLNPGQPYVAFFSASNLFDGEDGRGQMGLVSTNFVGGCAYMNNGDDFSLLTTEKWASISDDLAFTMVFNSASVPDLSAVFLLGSASLIGFAVRKRKLKK